MISKTEYGFFLAVHKRTMFLLLFRMSQDDSSDYNQFSQCPSRGIPSKQLRVSAASVVFSVRFMWYQKISKINCGVFEAPPPLLPILWRRGRKVVWLGRRIRRSWEKSFDSITIKKIPSAILQPFRFNSSRRLNSPSGSEPKSSSLFPFKLKRFWRTHPGEENIWLWVGKNESYL